MTKLTKLCSKSAFSEIFGQKKKKKATKRASKWSQYITLLKKKCIWAAFTTARLKLKAH